MISWKLGKFLKIMNDLEKRVRKLEDIVLEDSQDPRPADQTLYDRQTRLDEFVSRD